MTQPSPQIIYVHLQATARVHGDAASEARRRANASAFRSTNAAVQNTFTLDLHGQHVDEALASLERWVLLLLRLPHTTTPCCFSAALLRVDWGHVQPSAACGSMQLCSGFVRVQLCLPLPRLFRHCNGLEAVLPSLATGNCGFKHPTPPLTATAATW